MNVLTEQMQLHKYQAFGTVQGVLNFSQMNSTLLVGDTAFPVINYIPKQVRKFLQPGQVQQFKVFPVALHGKLAFKVLTITQNSVLGLKLKGCWERRWGAHYLVVYRNRLETPADNVFRILVPVFWEDAPVPDGQYWQLEAVIGRDQLIVTKAEGPFDPPPKATQFIPRKSARAQQSPHTTSSAPPLSLSAEEIRALATPAKMQLTCKLNQVPKHRERPDQQVEFSLSNGLDRTFTVPMKPKTFKKLTDHGFTEWIAAITGELGPATETGFELMNASVQIFEKKAREADTGAEAKAKPAAEPKPTIADPKPSAVAQPEQSAEAGKGQAKATGGVKPEKGKGLLDGVQLR